MHESFRLVGTNPSSARPLHAAKLAMIVMLGPITRRAFVTRSATLFSAFAVRPMRRWYQSSAIALRIGVAMPTSMAHEHRLGLELGLDEARHAAALFGGTIVDVPLESPSANAETLSAIVGGGDESFALAWARHAAQSSTIYMNVGCTSDRLRTEDCAPAAFHVAPSDTMSRDAIRAAGSPPNAHARAWDSSLSRFGADTLNQRFLTRFREPMTAGAWAAWFAVKAVWESALRQRSGDAVRIAEHLVRETTQFDGHKGTPLSFRSWDHQLRQPLYVASGDGGKTIQLKQVPEPTSDESIRDALDRLGGSKRTAACGVGHE
jgi:hypothetical protein